MADGPNGDHPGGLGYIALGLTVTALLVVRAVGPALWLAPLGSGSARRGSGEVKTTVPRRRVALARFGDPSGSAAHARADRLAGCRAAAPSTQGCGAAPVTSTHGASFTATETLVQDVLRQGRGRPPVVLRDGL